MSLEKYGNIVFLHGLTSAGKTSIIKELLSRKTYMFYVLGFDMFEHTIPSYAADRSNYYSKAIIAMYHAARSFSEQGEDVLIDGLIFNIVGLEHHYETLREIFEGFPLKIVHIHCPLEICRQRNLARGNRGEDQSLRQSWMAEKYIDYFCEIDTGEAGIKESADLLLEHVPLRKYGQKRPI